jgi:hypothetical protein
MTKLSLHLVMTIDGFIATEDGDAAPGAQWDREKAVVPRRLQRCRRPRLRPKDLHREPVNLPRCRRQAGGACLRSSGDGVELA